MTNEQEMLNELSEGVRNLVIELREAGFNTVDSGDGTNYENGMACAVPFKMIAILAPKDQAFDETDRLHEFMVKQTEEGKIKWLWQVEMSYSPSDGNCILTVVEHDPAMLEDLGMGPELEPGDEGYVEPGERFIVKVQASLFSTESEQQVIIYNESRSITYQCPASDCPDMVAALDPDMPKAFFWTTIDKAGRLQLNPHDTAEWQEW
jgi:hypothetical protein